MLLQCTVRLPGGSSCCTSGTQSVLSDLVEMVPGHASRPSSQHRSDLPYSQCAALVNEFLARCSLLPLVAAQEACVTGCRDGEGCIMWRRPGGTHVASQRGTSAVDVRAAIAVGAQIKCEDIDGTG